MWSQRRVGHLPLPYYGFETAEVTLGHGPAVGGDYRNWLETVHPEAVPLMRFEAGERPTSGAEQAAILDLPPELHYRHLGGRPQHRLPGTAGRARPAVLPALLLPRPAPPLLPAPPLG